MVNWFRSLWRKYLNWLYEPEPQTVVPTAGIKCPCCKTDYTEALKSIPPNASQATVVCSNVYCKEQMEVYPDARWGWLAPKTVSRSRYV